jgi:homoserine dehydrogenase
MRSINVGIIGFGTIGKAVFDVLNQNGDIISARTGAAIKTVAVCDTRKDILQAVGPGVKTTDTWRDITDDPSIDIVVELIGGINPAKDIILAALDSGKSVVTANKKLLAEAGAGIFAAAENSKGSLKFEAAVGGGIPCLLALGAGLVADRVKSIMGILNGTTNYILTQMEEKGLPFDAALKEAQAKGFAEADPTFDIEGYDAGHKIALLAMLAYNKSIDYKKIDIEGITRISDMDISYARDMGYVIRLLGIARMTENGLDISVHPTMVPSLHPLASVRNEFNAIMYDTDMTDPITLYGKGAGGNPTASAVISDIVQIMEQGQAGRAPLLHPDEAEYLPAERRISKYYMRIFTRDEPGILSRISGVLGRYAISIASVIQKESGQPYVPLIFMTHDINEASMTRAAREIGNFDFVDDNMLIIRVED